MASYSDCKAALEEHGARLNALPNVQGVGMGRVDESTKGYRLRVYVDEKLPEAKLDRASRIPKYVKLKRGNRFRYVYTQVIEQGKVTFDHSKTKESLE